MGEPLEVVGGLAHGRDHDDDVVAGAPGAHDVLGDGTDAVGVGDRRAAELLHEQAHDRRSYRRTLPILRREIRASVDSAAVPKATKRERQRQNRDARREAMQEAEKRTAAEPHRPQPRAPPRPDRPHPRDRVAHQQRRRRARRVGDTGSTMPRTYAKAARRDDDRPFGKTYTATIDTSRATSRSRSTRRTAPKTVNSFVFLARTSFYDGTLVPPHRRRTSSTRAATRRAPGRRSRLRPRPTSRPADGYKAGIGRRWRTRRRARRARSSSSSTRRGERRHSRPVQVLVLGTMTPPASRSRRRSTPRRPDERRQDRLIRRRSPIDGTITISATRRAPDRQPRRPRPDAVLTVEVEVALTWRRCTCATAGR